ncbi:MAG: NAD(P)/FAD-dependent oxidoreductase [Deltaproteobacteria bacterium]|nr:NAD(P)/FAD-dependent oxidoreductase [Deltaproteobacteria bacterium]
MRRCEVAVAGGGPAGLAAAITAALEGCSVTVIEPKAGAIDKACGEGLMPGGVRMLRELGVSGVAGHPFVGIRYAVAGRPGVVAHGTFEGARGLGVRRTELHRAMVERARAVGVRWLHEAVTSVEPLADRVRVAGLEARWLVAADGLRSPIRRMLGLELPARGARRFGVRRHYRMAPWSDRVEVWFAEGAEAYVTPVARDLVGVAFLYEPPARFEELLGRFPELAERLAGRAPVTKARGAGPFRQRVKARRAGRVLLAGDAAGYVDPLTGEGVALAMATGALAATCAARGVPEQYEAQWARVTRGYRVLTTALLAVARRPSLHRGLVAAARLMPFAFDGVLGMLDVDDVPPRLVVHCPA